MAWQDHCGLIWRGLGSRQSGRSRSVDKVRGSEDGGLRRPALSPLRGLEMMTVWVSHSAKALGYCRASLAGLPEGVPSAGLPDGRFRAGFWGGRSSWDVRMGGWNCGRMGVAKRGTGAVMAWAMRVLPSPTGRTTNDVGNAKALTRSPVSKSRQGRPRPAQRFSAGDRVQQHHPESRRDDRRGG